MQILSQQDPRWANVKIGQSNSLIKTYGCTITCLSMASDWFSCYHDPAWMAQNLSFLYDKILWSSIAPKLCFGFLWRFYTLDTLRIADGIKDPAKVCLLNVNGGRHWVLALKKVPLGYFVADPWTGSKRFYLSSSVVGGAILKK